MLEIWEDLNDNNKAFRSLTNLSKALNCLSHDLLIARVLA